MTSSSKKQLNSYGTFCVYLLSTTIIKTPNLGIFLKRHPDYQIPGESTPTLIEGVVILFRRIITLYKSISNMKHLKEIAVVIC